MQKVKDIIDQLPPELQQEVLDFVEFLLEKKVKKHNTEFKLTWRGALRNLRDQYTSVDLQHKALEWW